MPKEDVEEYLEAIHEITRKKGMAKTTDIAMHLKKAPASVTEVFQRMKRKGLIKYMPYRGVSLTAKGERIATHLKRKHRLVEVFLDKILGINHKHIHEQACRMEHTISDEVENALCRLLNAPARCPHGRFIDPCGKGVETCKECDGKSNNQLQTKTLVPITRLKPLQKGKIAFLRGNQKVIQRLSDLGLTPMTEVMIIRKAPMKGPIEIFIRRTTLAVTHDIADNIFVKIMR